MATTDTVKTLRPITINDCVHVFAVPGESHIIDVVRPDTGRTWHYGRTLADVQAKEPAAVLMTWEAFRADQIRRQNTPIVWQRSTRDTYREMLGVLPPAAWHGGGFLVGEPYDHSYETGRPRFQAFKQRGYDYFVSSRPLTIAEFRAEMER